MARFIGPKQQRIIRRDRINITDRLGILIILFVFMAYPGWAGQPPSAVLELTTDSPTATAGFYHLKWQGEGLLNSIYELQEANNAAFNQPATIYQGPDQGTLISGRKNGRYFYRVRALDQGKPASAWSPTVTVTVQHHSSARAFTFFAAGAAVFLATLALIVLGTRQSKKEKEQ